MARSIADAGARSACRRREAARVVFIRYFPANRFLIAQKLARKFLAACPRGWDGPDCCVVSHGILARFSREFILFAERILGPSNPGASQISSQVAPPVIRR